MRPTDIQTVTNNRKMDKVHMSTRSKRKCYNLETNANVDSFFLYIVKLLILLFLIMTSYNIYHASNFVILVISTLLFSIF